MSIMMISLGVSLFSILNGITGAIMATAAFFILMPTVTTEQGATMIDTVYMGSKGIIVAILCGILVPMLYVFLTDRDLKIKLPDSMPPMVSQSLEPMWAAMIIFSLAILGKFCFGFLLGGNLYDFVQNIVAVPLCGLALNPASAIIFAVACNIVWWLGVHPSAFMSIMGPLFMMAGMANTEAYLAGQPLPYITYSLISAYTYIGGQGNTLALACLFPFAKSDKYKSMAKLVLLPNLFNTNEPVIFGVPVMLNPFYLIPMAPSWLLAGLVTWGIIAIGLVPNLNPTIQTAWVMPCFVSSFLTGGFKHFLLMCVAFACNVLAYLPFFKADDAREYAEEQARMAELDK